MPGKNTPRWLAALLLLLVVQRVAYHSAYLADDPFALATFSDGRLYERAAEDILAHPPLGERPFYLQGAYAVMLAGPMALRAGPALGLLLQLLLVGLGLVAFHRACRHVYGPATGAGCTVLLLAYPGLSFYENKYLTAAIAEVSLALMLGALAWSMAEGRPRAAIAFGVATGLAILARGNMVLGLPAFGWAMVLLGRHHHGRSRPMVAAWAAGLLLTLAPMAVRNGIVTGRATVFPAHGGGTSFYIGNNAGAGGLWNTAGGLLSGDVGQERDELVERLAIEPGTEAEQAAAIGRALYRRAGAEIAADPGRWVRLEFRKLWLLTGNDELAQDYDAMGEAELIGPLREFGFPFPILVGLGLVGAVALRRTAPGVDAPKARDPQCARAWAWVLGGMAVSIVAANILFFTSAQHRVPLAVVLAALAGPGIVRLWRGIVDRSKPAWQRGWPLLIVLVVAAQGAVPRLRGHNAPSAAHYHNLALVQVEIGNPRKAIVTLGQALAIQPDHPVIRIERASLLRQLGYLDGADADLDYLETLDDLPDWIAARAAEERLRVQALYELPPHLLPAQQVPLH